MASSLTGRGTLRSGKMGMMYMYLVEGFHQRRTQATTDQRVREFLKGNVVVKGGGNAVYPYTNLSSSRTRIMLVVSLIRSFFRL